MSKISELSDGGVIQGGDTLIAVRSGGNVKVTYGGTTTANIDGGTIDGTVIGGTTAAAGSFTSLTSTGIDVTGTVVMDALTVGGTLGNFDISAGGNQATFDYNGFNYINSTGAGSALVFRMGSTNANALRLDSNGGVIVNDDSGDQDFRVESDGYSSMLFVNAGNNRVGIANGSPDQSLDIGVGGLQIKGNIAAPASGTSAMQVDYFSGGARYWSRGATAGVRGTHTFFTLTNTGGSQISPLIIDNTGGVIINDNSVNADFRVESDTNTHMLFMDATNNRVNIGTTDVSSQGTLAVNGSAIFGRGSTTTGDFITSGGGNNSTYNGVAILSNSDEITAQANTSLSSWIVDIGGRASDGVTYPVATRDAFGVRRVAPGGAYLSAANYLQIDAGATVFNEDSNDQDFRVESNNQTHALFVDAGNDNVLIGNSGQNTAFSEKVNVGLQIGKPGQDDNGGHMFMTQEAAQNTWKTICAAHDNGATGLLFLIHGVRNIDQNRSYGAMVRFAYSDAFNIMSVNSQNATVEYRVSGNNLQYRFTSQGTYIVNLTVMAAG